MASVKYSHDFAAGITFVAFVVEEVTHSHEPTDSYICTLQFPSALMNVITTL